MLLLQKYFVKCSTLQETADKSYSAPWVFYGKPMDCYGILIHTHSITDFTVVNYCLS